MTNIDTTDKIQTDWTEIETVTNYEYPGQTIAMVNRTKQVVSIRINEDWVFLENTEKSLWTGTFPWV